MPTPATTDLPRPKSWDEFEDICADLLKRSWNTPYVTRNGRQGQQQKGVDIYGQPSYLAHKSSTPYAGVQCKKVDKLTIADIEKEVEKAKSFIPQLDQYIIMTTLYRDANLQEQVRQLRCPFQQGIIIWFWEDISLELAGYDDLLRKHFPNWKQHSQTKDAITEILLNAEPEEFDYDDEKGEYFYTKDVNLRLVCDRSEKSERDFNEPWVREFPDPQATREIIYVYYNQTKVGTLYCASVDGGRYTIPYPKSRYELTINRYQYKLGCILNHPFSSSLGFDGALRLAGIDVSDS
jgi:hypothetical protein